MKRLDLGLMNTYRSEDMSDAFDVMADVVNDVVDTSDDMAAVDVAGRVFLAVCHATGLRGDEVTHVLQGIALKAILEVSAKMATIDAEQDV